MSERDEARLWHLRSGVIDEWVRAIDQWEAWMTLRDRPVTDFGLLATAEPDEAGEDDVLLARSSGLMFWFGRDADAEDLIAAAMANGLPDTTERDRRFGR